MRNLLVLLALLPSLALARTGSEGGGGGNKLIAEFVSTANTLLAKEAFAPEHLALLKDALEHSQIVTTKQLLHPVTKQPLSNQEKLIAWGSPGLVQLKQKGILFEDSFEDALATSRPIAHIVIHELFRASGERGADGKSIDENFQLSIGQYHLEQNATAGTIRVERGSQFLYAECKVVSCQKVGHWWDHEKQDLTCDPKDKSRGNRGYLGATLSVYKYAGTNDANKKDGLFIIHDAGGETRWRLGNEYFSAVKILEGEKEMTMVSDSEGSEYRNFKITYSSTRQPITTGHLDIRWGGNPASWVQMDLADCQTMSR